MRHRSFTPFVAVGFALTVAACETERVAGLETTPSFKSANAPVHLVSAGGVVDFSLFPGGGAEFYGLHASIDGNGVARGQVQIDFSIPDVTFHMDINCLSVVGTDAFLGGTVTQTHDATQIPVGTHFFFRVQDNGEGNAAPPDALSFFFFVQDPGICTGNFLVDIFPWTHGNVQVK